MLKRDFRCATSFSYVYIAEFDEHGRRWLQRNFYLFNEAFCPMTTRFLLTHTNISQTFVQER